MKNFYISQIHLNNFKKYILQKEHEKQNISNRKKKRNNSVNSALKINSFQDKKINQNLSNNMIEEKDVFETPIKKNIIKRPILTPIQKMKSKLFEPKKRNEIDSEPEFFSPIKIKFNLNNLVNTILYNLYMKKSYKKLLIQKSNLFMPKNEKEENLKLDLRNTQKKGRFYIPIKNRNLRAKNEKREIGIQNSLSSQNEDDDNNNNINISNIIENRNKNEEKFFENNKVEDKNRNKYNRNTSCNFFSYDKKNKKNQIRNYLPEKKKKHHKINSCKSSFNKYELINKKLAKNFLDFSFRSKYPRYTKIKKLIHNENQKVGKFLTKLRCEQNNISEKVKLDLAKLDGYIAKKNKKNNNNSYNLFL